MTAANPMCRRDFLRLGGVALAGAAALPWVLDACGGTAAPASTAVGSASAKGSVLPAYVPFQGPKPDLAALPNGTPPGFLNYPQHAVKSVASPPGKGGAINALAFTLFAPPPPVDQNPAWQQVNKELNATVSMTVVPVADYFTRVAATIAGGDLPDIFVMSALGSTIQGEPQFLQQSAADLTPYLAGDGIKAYPNLANLPSYVWPSAIFGGHIYKVPSPVGGRTGPALHTKQKLLDDAGVNVPFKNIDEFTQALKALRIPGKQYGIGWNPLQWFQQVFGAPNDWQEQGGKLTKDIETPEFKAAVAYVRSIWDQQLMHPDSPGLNRSTGAQAWYRGEYAFLLNAFTAWQFAWTSAVAQDPAFKPRITPVFSHDGTSPPVYYLGTGASSLSVIKKSTPDREQELLGVLNYIAAPFGTTEQLLLTYGVKDVDFTVDAKGNPHSTKKGTADVSVPWYRLANYPDVLFAPDLADFVQVTHQAENDALSHGIPSPVAGLYSKTYAEKSAVLNQQLTDGLAQIVFGRQPVSSLDGLVQSWRSGGGDQIRAEYQQALQNSTK